MTPERAIKTAKEMQEEINKSKLKKIQVNEENVYDLKMESITKDLERLQTIQTIEKPKVFTSVELFLINEIQELKQENKELKQALFNQNLKMNMSNEIEKLNNNKKKFTKDELIILKNIDKDFNFIARDKDSGLYLFEYAPHKRLDKWQRYNCCLESFSPYNNLFKDIKWEDDKPIYIDDYVER